MNTYIITTKQVHLIILLIKELKHLHQSNPLQVLSSDTPSVGSVSGGGRYDELVGMFDTKGRKVCFISSYIIY